jgi:hypothetical protein
MNRETIINEIRRVAELEPLGKLGQLRFEKISGISAGVWRGKYWTTWSEAVKEAGVLPGEKTIAYSDENLLAALAELVRLYKRFPTQAETKIEKRKRSDFPNFATFYKLGQKDSKINKLHQFATRNSSYSDILQYLPKVEVTSDETQIKDHVSHLRKH